MAGTAFQGAAQGTKPLLSSALQEALQSGHRSTLIFDFDGTLFPFSDNPQSVTIDPDCRAALTELCQRDNVRVVGLTGRSVQRALEMVGQDLGARIEIVGSHGAEYKNATGEVTMFPFGDKQIESVDTLREAVDGLQGRYPKLHIETDKFGSVGVNISAYKNDETGREIRSEVFALFEQFHDESFAVAYEAGQNGWEVELRPSETVCGKHVGITHFIKPDASGLVLFAGDSFGDHGTDTPAATLINDKEKFPKGVVVMVMNGRNTVPPQGAPQSPAYVMESSNALGRELLTACNTDVDESQPELGRDQRSHHPLGADARP